MRKTILLVRRWLVALTAAAGHDVAATHSSAAVVLKWNQLLQSTLPQPGNPLTPPLLRDDAHRDVRCDQRHRARVRAVSGPAAARVWGSAQAAAAQAAHDVLVALNPSAAAAYDAALAADLGERPSGFVRRGAEIGAHVAKEILAWRQA